MPSQRIKEVSTCLRLEKWSLKIERGLEEDTNTALKP